MSESVSEAAHRWLPDALAEVGYRELAAALATAFTVELTKLAACAEVDTWPSRAPAGLETLQLGVAPGEPVIAVLIQRHIHGRRGDVWVHADMLGKATWWPYWRVRDLVSLAKLDDAVAEVMGEIRVHMRRLTMGWN